MERELFLLKEDIKTVISSLNNPAINYYRKKDMSERLGKMVEKYNKLSKVQHRVNTSRKGIYFIINESKKRMYIGKSSNMYKRLQKHYSELNTGKHSNSLLQEHFNKRGTEETYIKYFIPTKKDKPLDVENALISYCFDNGIRLYNYMVVRTDEEEYTPYVEKYKKELERAIELMNEGE